LGSKSIFKPFKQIGTDPKKTQIFMDRNEQHCLKLQKPDMVQKCPDGSSKTTAGDSHLHRVEMVAGLQVLLLIFLLQELQVAHQTAELPRLHRYKGILIISIDWFILCKYRLKGQSHEIELTLIDIT